MCLKDIKYNSYILQHNKSNRFNNDYNSKTYQIYETILREFPHLSLCEKEFLFNKRIKTMVK